jgi:hypothetical protein
MTTDGRGAELYYTAEQKNSSNMEYVQKRGDSFMSEETKKQQSCNPEKLSGHNLVNYLIANPEVRGNFRYHTFLSCMWRNLLIAQPGFTDVADFEKIHHHDIYKILLEQPQLAPYFDFSKLWDAENRCLFLKRPEIATPETTAYLYISTWCNILKRHPQLGEFCPWKKFSTTDWCDVLRPNGKCLKYLKLANVASAVSLRTILKHCYLSLEYPVKGFFEQGVSDAASFLIFKQMDRTNSKHFLKKQLAEGNWDFVDDLCSISPEDALDVSSKRYIRFFMTLSAPDHVFEKLFPLFDLKERDSGGNSHLLAALVRGLVSYDLSRYNFLLEQGLDPDEKNMAGFSCNELAAHLENLKAKEEAAKLARNESARKRAKERRALAKKVKNIR